VGPVLSQ